MSGENFGYCSFVTTLGLIKESTAGMPDEATEIKVTKKVLTPKYGKEELQSIQSGDWLDPNVWRTANKNTLEVDGEGGREMTINKSLFSSDRMDWETPQELFERYREECDLNLDVCASANNAKLSHYFDETIDGLKQDWLGHRCWMNPPYGRTIGLWVSKAFETAKHGGLVVALLPVRTDTAWFHNFVLPGVRAGFVELRFLRGRIKFVGAKSSAPFPSMIVIFGRQK